jgi:hypothetical protein
LLDAAECPVSMFFVTADKNMRYQQNLARRRHSPCRPRHAASASAKKPAKHVAEPHGQVKTGAKEPEHRESETGPK